MYKKTFNVIGRDGAIHLHEKKPSQKYVPFLTTTEDGTGSQLVWAKDGKVPEGMPCCRANEERMPA